MRKNCFSDREKLLKFEAEGQEFAKVLRYLLRTIYLNSESSEQFLVTESLFDLFLEVSPIIWIRTIRIQIGQKLGFRNIEEKLEKDFSEKSPIGFQMYF